MVSLLAVIQHIITVAPSTTMSLRHSHQLKYVTVRVLEINAAGRDADLRRDRGEPRRYLEAWPTAGHNIPRDWDRMSLDALYRALNESASTRDAADDHRGAARGGRG